jgi:hypothetical protein
LAFLGVGWFSLTSRARIEGTDARRLPGGAELPPIEAHFVKPGTGKGGTWPGTPE